jgi:hypothetical protein
MQNSHSPSRHLSVNSSLLLTSQIPFSFLPEFLFPPFFICTNPLSFRIIPLLKYYVLSPSPITNFLFYLNVSLPFLLSSFASPKFLFLSPNLNSSFLMPFPLLNSSFFSPSLNSSFLSLFSLLNSSFLSPFLNLFLVFP